MSWPRRCGFESRRRWTGWPTCWCMSSRTRPRCRAGRMENREIARVLAETADLMEIAGEDGFRIRSYRNAASAIEGYPERVADILANPERKVTEIPGVGKGLASVIDELSKRGSFEKRDALLAQFPPTLLELFKIQGLGPKGIALVYQHHKVATIDELERLCH